MRPRVRPGFRRLAIVAAIILLPIAAHTLWDYLELRRLVRKIETIRAKGEPVTEQEAGRGYRKLSADENLTARYYMAAAALAHPAVAQEWAALSPLHAHLAGYTPEGFQISSMRERIAGPVAAGAEALRLLDRTSGRPFKGFPAGTEYNYRTSELLALLLLQSMRTTHLALSGAGDDAVASALTSIEARRIISDTYSWTRRVTFEVPAILSYADASPEPLRRLERALAGVDQPGGVERMVLGDRAAFIDLVFRQFYGGDASMPQTVGTSPVWRGRRGFVDALWRPWLTREFVRALDNWEALIEAARLPWPEKARRMREVHSRFPQPDRSSSSWWPPRVITNAMLVVPTNFTAPTLDRASRTAIGVRLFLADQGRLPSSLSELEGKYLPELPLDPETGGPLRLSVSGGAFTVYGVGPDGRDDGGDLISEWRTADARGFGVKRVRGKDIGIRVLLNPK